MRCTAEILWQAEGGFAANRYSRRHAWRFDGGAQVMASASPEIVRPPLSDPTGVDPEEAMVASVSSCHMLWFLDLARQAGFAVASYRDRASAALERGDDGRMALLRFELRPEIAFEGRQPGAEELDKLHHDAHERCFIANSLRGEVVILAP